MDTGGHTCSEDQVKTRGEHGRLESRGEASAEPTLPTPSSGTPASRTMRKYISAIGAPCHGGLSRLLQPGWPTAASLQQSGLGTGHLHGEASPSPSPGPNIAAPPRPLSHTAWLCLRRFFIPSEMIWCLPPASPTTGILSPRGKDVSLSVPLYPPQEQGPAL